MEAMAERNRHHLVGMAPEDEGWQLQRFIALRYVVDIIRNDVVHGLRERMFCRRRVERACIFRDGAR